MQQFIRYKRSIGSFRYFNVFIVRDHCANKFEKLQAKKNKYLYVYIYIYIYIYIYTQFFVVQDINKNRY